MVVVVQGGHSRNRWTSLLLSSHHSHVNFCLQHQSTKLVSFHFVHSGEEEVPERAKGISLYSALVVDGDVIPMMHCRE